MTKRIFLSIIAIIILGAYGQIQAQNETRPKDSAAIDDKMNRASPTPYNDSIEQDEEGQINVTTPILISDEWMKQAFIYKNKNLPHKMINVIDTLGGEGSFMNFDSSTFFIEKTNLDEDSSQEVVIAFLDGAIGMMGVIKRIDNHWYMISEVNSGIHIDYPVSIDIDRKNKLITWTGETWGFSAGTTIEYYKLIKGKLYKAFGFYEQMYWAGMGDNSLGCEITARDSFSPDQKIITVHYTYDAFKEIIPDNYDFDMNGEVSRLFILKGQDTTVQYKWDDVSHSYLPTSNNPFKDDKDDYPDSESFFDLFENKIKYISKHGTRKQRKALAYLNKKK